MWNIIIGAVAGGLGVVGIERRRRRTALAESFAIGYRAGARDEVRAQLAQPDQEQQSG